MVALAITVGLLMLAGALALLVATRLLAGLLGEVRDNLRVLHVAVNGLEAALAADLTTASEASEATLVRVGQLVDAMELLKTGADVETAREADVREALAGRVRSARSLFAAAEAESLAASMRAQDRG